MDKLFGFGYATASGKGWIDGGDPTAGFLGKGTSGPFADFYQGLVGDWWVTPLFMVGLSALLMVGLGIWVMWVANETTAVSMTSVRGDACPRLPALDHAQPAGDDEDAVPPPPMNMAILSTAGSAWTIWLSSS